MKLLKLLSVLLSYNLLQTKIAKVCSGCRGLRHLFQLLDIKKRGCFSEPEGTGHHWDCPCTMISLHLHHPLRWAYSFHRISRKGNLQSTLGSLFVILYLSLSAKSSFCLTSIFHVLHVAIYDHSFLFGSQQKIWTADCNSLEPSV